VAGYGFAFNPPYGFATRYSLTHIVALDCFAALAMTGDRECTGRRLHRGPQHPGREFGAAKVKALALGGLAGGGFEHEIEDALAAFLAGNVDAFAAGLTERVEARRHGAVELLTEADVMSPVTNGLITTEAFAAKHKDVLDKLMADWFRTIEYISADVPQNSLEIRDYLRTSASTRYSPEEYSIAWTFDVFPQNKSQANEMFNKPSSGFYWKKSWDDVSNVLIANKVVKSRPPYDAYMGARSLSP